MPLLPLTQEEYKNNHDRLRHTKAWLEEGSRELWWELYAKYGPKRKDGLLVTQKEANKRTRIANPEKAMWHRAKARSKARALPFNIEVSDIKIPQVCPVLGIKIEPLSMDSKGTSPNSPSLDQIIPGLGYVKGNIQVISHRANTLKSDGTLEEFKKLVIFLGS